MSAEWHLVRREPRVCVRVVENHTRLSDSISGAGVSGGGSGSGSVSGSDATESDSDSVGGGGGWRRRGSRLGFREGLALAAARAELAEVANPARRLLEGGEPADVFGTLDELLEDTTLRLLRSWYRRAREGGGDSGSGSGSSG